jgi:hypothetical protein
VTSGELRAVDAQKSAIALGAMLEGTLLLWAFAPDRVDMETQLMYGMDLFIQAITE